MTKDISRTYNIGIKRQNTLSKELLEHFENTLRDKYNNLVKKGRVPKNQFNSFATGYGLAMIEFNTRMKKPLE